MLYPGGGERLQKTKFRFPDGKYSTLGQSNHETPTAIATIATIKQSDRENRAMIHEFNPVTPEVNFEPATEIQPISDENRLRLFETDGDTPSKFSLANNLDAAAGMVVNETIKESPTAQLIAKAISRKSCPDVS